MNLPKQFRSDPGRRRKASGYLKSIGKQLNLPQFIKYCSILIHPLLLEYHFKVAIQNLGGQVDVHDGPLPLKKDEEDQERLAQLGLEADDSDDGIVGDEEDDELIRSDDEDDNKSNENVVANEKNETAIETENETQEPQKGDETVTTQPAPTTTATATATGAETGAETEQDKGNEETSKAP